MNVAEYETDVNGTVKEGSTSFPRIFTSTNTLINTMLVLLHQTIPIQQMKFVQLMILMLLFQASVKFLNLVAKFNDEKVCYLGRCAGTSGSMKEFTLSSLKEARYLKS